MSNEKVKWFQPPQATRFHMFGEDGRALCGRWWHPQAWTHGEDMKADATQQKDDCAGCWKAAKKHGVV